MILSVERRKLFASMRQWFTKIWPGCVLALGTAAAVGLVVAAVISIFSTARLNGLSHERTSMCRAECADHSMVYDTWIVRNEGDLECVCKDEAKIFTIEDHVASEK